jgi:hypothetical protein
MDKTNQIPSEPKPIKTYLLKTHTDKWSRVIKFNSKQQNSAGDSISVNDTLNELLELGLKTVKI